MPDNLKLFNRVKIDVNEALDQMLVSLNSSRMVAILPKCAVATFSLIEFLSRSARNQLNCSWNAFPASNIVEQEMNMIRCNHVIQDACAITLLRLK